MEALRFIKRQVRKYPRLAETLQGPSVAVTVAMRRMRMRYLYTQDHLSNAAMSAWIAERIGRAEPGVIGRLGTLEFELLAYDSRRGRAGARRPVPSELRRLAFANVGLFPDDDASLWRCIDTIRAALGEVNALGVYGHRGEGALIERDARSVQVTGETDAFEPWFATQPWTAALAGKRVLVVHPFVSTIRKQYELSRTRIWATRPALLPEFALDTLRMPLSPGIYPSNDESWHARLQRLCGTMAERRFDVALIGAGGMSLPLAAEARKLGAIGIHMGGATQLLFGIRGRRWDHSPEHCKLFNDAWTRPGGDEAPEAAATIEDGCYW